jgi:hypothetical protein
MHRLLGAARGWGIVLWLVLGLAVWAGDGRFNMLNGEPFPEDLVVFHAAGTACRTGHCAELYDQTEGRAFQHASFGPTHRKIYHRYTSAPHTALLWIPASLLPYPVVAVLLCAANLALLFISLRFLRVRVPFMAVFGFYPVFDAFVCGQNVFLSLALFVAALRLWLGGRPFWAGVVAGCVAAYKPHLLAGVGLLWLLESRRDLRPLLGLLVPVAVFALVDVVFFWPQTRTYLGWVTGVLGGQVPFWEEARPGGEMTLKELFTMMVPGTGAVATALAAGCAVAGIALFVLYWRRRRADRRAIFAAAILLSLWIAPHAHLYEWTLLLVPATLLWRPRFLRLYVLVYLATTIIVQVARWQWHALGFAIHPAVPLLAFVAFRVLVAAGDGLAASRSAGRAPPALPA